MAFKVARSLNLVSKVSRSSFRLAFKPQVWKKFVGRKVFVFTIPLLHICNLKFLAKKLVFLWEYYHFYFLRNGSCVLRWLFFDSTHKAGEIDDGVVVEHGQPDFIDKDLAK
jgi:hypothetical protein